MDNKDKDWNMIQRFHQKRALTKLVFDTVLFVGVCLILFIIVSKAL